MYLIHIPAERAHIDHWLYFDEDPRPKGCTHSVVEGVEFQDLPAEDAGRGGSTVNLKMPVLARDPKAPRFGLYPCKIAVPLEYELLPGIAFSFPTWADFMATPICKDDQWRPLK